MEKRKLKPKELVNDIRSGTDDATLMHRYSLSAQGLQSVFRKLVQAGMMSQSELDDRVPAAERTVDIGLYICPACGNIQGKEFTECPRCGFVAPGYMKRAKEVEAPPKVEPAKQTIASKSQVINLKTDKKVPVPVPAAPHLAVTGENGGPAFDELRKILTYCRRLGVATLVCCALAVLAMIALTQLGLPAGTFSMGQSLLATLALGIPVIVTAAMVFLTLKALGESIRIFLRISGAETE